MKNELFDMYSWLRGYLYIVLLMIISSSSFAVTEKEIAMGGFAYTVYCSHPSNLDFCVNASYTDAKKQASRQSNSYINS